MKTYQPTRTHMVIVLWIVVMQAIALISIVAEPNDPTQNNHLVVIDSANSLVMRYAEDVDLAEGLGRYDQVILALEAYYANTGDYPATLEKLVPNYLSQSPAIYFAYGEELRYEPKPLGDSTAPFLLYIYGHYPGGASMHGWFVKYCPAQFDLCNETSDRHFHPSRINQRWIWVSSSAL